MKDFMPNFAIGFNGKLNDLKQIINTGANIESVYSGGLPNIIAGGRPQYANSIDELKECISLAHEKKILYEIALNTPCGVNDKTDKKWWQEVEDYFKLLEDCGVDRVVISHPFLINLVKSKTNMEVAVSTICEVTEPRMAKYYEEMGADILIPSMNINFKLDKLSAIKQTLKNTKLRVMLNEHCLGDCPWRRFHHSHYAHSNYEIDYHMNCKRKFMKSPYLNITNNCIRPEDMIRYKDITDNFKIVGRLVSISTLVERISAYSSQTYKGNYINLSDEKMADIIKIPNYELNEIFDMKSRCDFNCDECKYCSKLYDRITKTLEEPKSVNVYSDSI